MGFRLHVARTYRVEYGSTEAFNYAVEEFHTLLSALSVPYTGDDYDDEFEIDKEDWFKGIGKLRNLANLREDERENITSALQGLGCTVEEAIELFEAYIRESDQGNYYMHFRFL